MTYLSVIAAAGAAALVAASAQAEVAPGPSPARPLHKPATAANANTGEALRKSMIDAAAAK